MIIFVWQLTIEDLLSETLYLFECTDVNFAQNDSISLYVYDRGWVGGWGVPENYMQELSL